MQNYSTHTLLKQEISRCSASLFLAAVLAVLAGCGGGSDTPTAASATSTSGGSTTPVVLAATVQLLVSSPQIPSAGATTVDLTAVVLSATNQTVSGRTVTFSTGTDSTAFINTISAVGVSDTNGLVTAKLNLGGDKTNRKIVIIATADSVPSQPNSVDVTGTNITISGNTSLASGNSTTLTFTVKDSAGTAIPGVSLIVASAAGNTITLKPGGGLTCASASTCNTDNSGQLLADVKATVGTATTDTITATGGGTANTQALSINPASFSFQTPTLVAPATTIDIPINTPTNVSVKWTNTAAPVPAGTPVTFSSTRGVIANRTPDCLAAAATAVTDAAGNACVQISSSLAGPAIITAAGVPAATSPAATLTIVFVSRSAANVTVQAVPGTVGVSIPGSTSQTNNVSTITATVRDGTGVTANLVKNAGITFSLTDPTAGTLSSGTARTDVSGSASVTYTAGQVSSASNGVSIKATVTDITNAVPPIAPVSSCTLVAGTSSCLPAPVAPEVAGFPDARLTVASQPLLVRIGFDDKISLSGPATTYQKNYSATVTDAAGNPVVGATVRFSLRAGRYMKGFWQLVPSGTSSIWAQFKTIATSSSVAPYCANEDINFNGILDPGEDLNGNGALEPGGVASVTASATTDANGIAIAIITYPQDHATWTEVILEARSGVVGNDPPTTVTIFLPGDAAAINDVAKFPPFMISPFGVDTTCFDTK